MELNIDGANIYYEVHGEGAPLVLIAGLTAHSQSWPNQLLPFSSRFKTIIFDNRNAGRSSVDGTNYSIKTMADDVAALLDYLGIESAHILGRSMGGCIAQEFAINYPTRVNKLVLEGTSPRFPERTNLLLSHFLKLKDPSVDQRLFFEGFIFWENSPLLVNDSKVLEDAITFCLADPYLQSYEGYKNQIRAIKEHNTVDRVHLITAPTFVVTGDLDILVLPSESELFAEKIAKVEWKKIPGAGHSIHNDQAEIFNQAVLKFLG